MKNIKLFEQYNEDCQTEKELIQSIYEDWREENEDALKLILEGEQLNMFPDEDGDEDDALDNERILTSGERAALTRDFQVISEPQMAAIYLRALGRFEEEDPGKYLVMIQGIIPFGEISKTNGEFILTVPALADAIGLNSAGTITRTTRKFENLLNGLGETSNESLYPKIYAAYEKFSEMRPSDIAILAAETIQDTASTKHRDSVGSIYARSKEAKKKRDAEKIKLGKAVLDLIRKLKSGSSIFNAPGKAERTAIATLAREYGMGEELLRSAFNAYLLSTKDATLIKFRS
jgi:hypothetical protein